MTDKALATLFETFSTKWPDFGLRRSKKTWIKATDDNAMLLMQMQLSSFSRLYYINFGIYYLDMEPLDKPLSNTPKSTHWHLRARYENFQELATNEYNMLFSLEEIDSESLVTRCAVVADFAKANIIPQLVMLGSLHSFGERMTAQGSEEIFDPFHTQKIAKREILEFLSRKISTRNRRGGHQ